MLLLGSKFYAVWIYLAQNAFYLKFLSALNILAFQEGNLFSLLLTIMLRSEDTNLIFVTRNVSPLVYVAVQVYATLNYV